MKVRADVARMLRAGATYEQIHAELGVDNRETARTRRALDIPLARGAGHRLSPQDRARVHARIAELLHTTATYDEIAAETGVSRRTVARVHTQQDITRPPRPSRALTPEQMYASRAQPCEDGHARWTGAWATRMPQILIPGPPGRRKKGRKESALRVAFRLHHGREPEGHVRRDCTAPWCVAGAHLTDQRMRAERTPHPRTTP